MEKLIMYFVNYFGLGVTSLNAILGTLYSSFASISTGASTSSTIEGAFGSEEDTTKALSSSLLGASSTISSALSIENVEEDLKDVDNTTAYIESLSTEDLDNLIANLSSDIELNEEEELTRKLTKNNM
jgi:hypothetical protein